MTEVTLSSLDQSQQPKMFVKDVTLDNEKGGRTEGYSEFR